MYIFPHNFVRFSEVYIHYCPKYDFISLPFYGPGGMVRYTESRTYFLQPHYYTINPSLNLRPQSSWNAYLVINRCHNLIHTHFFPSGSVCLERFAQELNRSTSLIFVLVERTLVTTPLGPAPRVGRQNDVVWVNVDVAHFVVWLEMDCDVVVLDFYSYGTRIRCHSWEHVVVVEVPGCDVSKQWLDTVDWQTGGRWRNRWEKLFFEQVTDKSYDLLEERRKVGRWVHIPGTHHFYATFEGLRLPVLRNTPPVLGKAILWLQTCTCPAHHCPRERVVSQLAEVWLG